MTIPKFQSSKKSVGLEIVDIYLWLYKRYLDGKLSNPHLIHFVKFHANKVYCDEVSIKATINRFEGWMENLPQITYEQELIAKKMKDEEDKKRRLHVEKYYKSQPINELD